MFIAFEGIDGSGKTTNSKLLYESLRQRNKAFLTKEPTDGIIGKSLRELLMHENDISPMAMQMLFAADREEHISKVILPKLDEGYHVITDRYLLSTLAYGIASGIEKKRLEGISHVLLKPTITFILDISAEKAHERMEKTNKARSIYENREFLERTRAAYLSLAKEHDNCFLVDADRKLEEVSKEIQKLVEKQI